jgi:NAD(P)-dependent dehydrogenase (short-subunit alcohol dehydrogenase family)
MYAAPEAIGVKDGERSNAMAGKLDGKIAVVTGGSAGIGLGTAKRFVAEGAQVFITGRRRSELDKAVADIGVNVTAIQADTAKLSDIDGIYQVVRAKAGRIDVMFANAGFYELGTFGEITEEHFDRTFNTNVRGLLFTVQKALPLLSRGSSVILTGSIASMKGFPSMSVYQATKAAVRALARGWILDLKGRDIRINVLSPGHIQTPGLSVLMDEDTQSSLITHIPLNRMGGPDDIAAAALFLASDDSRYVTGTELFVDGGVAQY